MNQEELFLARYISIAELGATIDGQLVTTLSHPDNDPATNWHSIGCVDNFEMTARTKAIDPFLCFDSAGNLVEVNQDISTGDGFNCQAREMDDLARRLAYGINGPIQESVPVNAFEKAIREIEVWAKVDALNINTKVIDHTFNMQCVIKLTNSGAIQNGTSIRPQYVFEKRGPAPTVIRFGPAA